MRSEVSRIFAYTRTGWELIDVSSAPARFSAHLPPGRHELTRIADPFGSNAAWLVVRGTKIGQLERNWRMWRNGETQDRFGTPINWGVNEIIIQEVDTAKNLTDSLRATDTERRRVIIEKIQQRALRLGKRVKVII